MVKKLIDKVQLGVIEFKPVVVGLLLRTQLVLKVRA